MCDIKVYLLTFYFYLFQDFHCVCNVSSTIYMHFVSLSFPLIFLVYYWLSCSYMGPTGIL
jgi:hypothetical protein